MNPDNLWDYSVQVCLYFLKEMLDHPNLTNVQVKSSDASLTKENLLQSDQYINYVPYKVENSNHIYVTGEHLVEAQILTAGIALHYDHDEQIAHLVLMPLDLSEGSPLTAFNLDMFSDVEKNANYYYESFIEVVDMMENNNEQ
jgi:hypothetical protein